MNKLKLVVVYFRLAGDCKIISFIKNRMKIFYTLKPNTFYKS